MTLPSKLGVAVVCLLAASGCAHSTRVASVHVEEPGTHIVSGQGAISIARNTNTGSRVCTRVLPAKGGQRAKGPPRAPDPGARLDVLLFRLCEARSNGDISAEQYASSIQSIVKSLEQLANRPPMPMRPGRRDDDAQPGWRGRGGGRRWEFRGWNRPDDDRDETPTPGPARPEPKKEAPK